MFLDKLSDWPSPKTTRLLLIFSFLLYIIISPILTYFFTISNYPVSFVESQLSFSGATIKSHFSTMSAEDINIYRIAQLIDYVFMVSYGTLIFSLALTIARKFEENSGWRKTGYLASVFGIVAACCDAIENAFILLMLTDPLGFPDIWAIAHSCFALVKFILMGLSWGFIAVAGLTLLIIKKRSS